MAYYLDSTKLAYLIEISFVLNLAYLELKSFKIVHGIKKKIEEITNRYEGLRELTTSGQTHDDHIALHTAYEALVNFDKGKGEGWESDRRKRKRRGDRGQQYQQQEQRHLSDRREKNCPKLKFSKIWCPILRLFYKWLLRKNLDRLITKVCLIFVVSILIAITIIEASNKQQALSCFLLSQISIEWNHVFWFFCFPVVLFSTFWPATMMLFSRNLVHFFLGTKEEEDFEKAFDKFGENEKCGRFNQLKGDFESHFQKFFADSLKKAHQIVERA